MNEPQARQIIKDFRYAWIAENPQLFAEQFTDFYKRFGKDYDVQIDSLGARTGFQIIATRRPEDGGATCA